MVKRTYSAVFLVKQEQPTHHRASGLVMVIRAGCAGKRIYRYFVAVFFESCLQLLCSVLRGFTYAAFVGTADADSGHEA